MVAVHDCFGCIAPHAKRLKEILGEQFERLHDHDLLAGVLESVRAAVPKNIKLPPLPKRGNLKLGVRKNYNAFK
jgi:DNA-directed RNA polymerase